MLVCSLSGPTGPIAVIPLLAPQTNPTFELSRDAHVAIANPQFSEVASGDFHHDRKPEFIVGSPPQRDIVPRLGNGDGAFQAPSDVDHHNLDTAQKTVAVI